MCIRDSEAALARGCKVTGATVHCVNEECDGGPSLLQKAVDSRPGDTPEVLQKRVREQADKALDILHANGEPEAYRLGVIAEGEGVELC